MQKELLINSMSTKTQIAAITNPILGQAGHNAGGAQSGSLLFTIIGGVLQFMMVVGVLYTLINLVQGGIAWIGGGGDSGKIEKARDRITQAVIGLIVLSASFAIWKLAKEFLGVNLSFTPLFPN